MHLRPILRALGISAVLASVAGCATATTSGSELRGAAGLPNAAVPAAPLGGAGASAPGPSSASSVAAVSGDLVVGTPGADVARSVTAAYTVPAHSFLDSFDTVIADAAALGGYVVSSQTSPDRNGVIVSGKVTLAVPTAQLASLLNSLPPNVFTASSIDFQSVDDRANVIDVNARLASAQAHLTALQGLLAKSTSLNDITTLEQQIEDVETSIDTDQSDLTALNQSVTFATATIELSERGAVVARAAPTGPSLTAGITKGWANMVLILSIALEVLVSAVPGIALALLGWLAWRRLRGRAVPSASRPTPGPDLG